MACKDKLITLKSYVFTFLKWGAFGLFMGLWGGLLGAGFHHLLHFVTQLRTTHTWLLFLLPAAGLLSVGIYTLFRQRENRGTNQVIDAVLKGEEVSAYVSPTIILASAVTHMFGGSAGREGAALQIGASNASLISRGLRLGRRDRRVMILCGMSAVFAGLFGTPLTATLFCMEFISVGMLFSPALLPGYLAAYTASRISAALGVHAEGLPLEAAAAVTLGNVWKFLILAILISCIGVFMCWLFHKAEHLAQHCIKNPWLRIAAGGTVILVLTLLVGDQRYSGAGMEMALGAVEGNAHWFDFLLKLLFTALTLASGFKGGEIVPTFCIGATFGCVVGGLLGLDAGLCGALGLVGLFCCATNSPFASIILSIEMFGSANLHLFALVCVICFMLSGHIGLYSSQMQIFYSTSLAAKSQAKE